MIRCDDRYWMNTNLFLCHMSHQYILAQHNKNDYNCSCSNEWEGKTCSKYNFCHIDPCLNSGTCLNGETDYTLSHALYKFLCLYKESYYKDENDMYTHQLRLNNFLEPYMVDCCKSLVVDYCQYEDFCLSSPCSNNGTCQHNKNDYNCSCSNEWEGKTCSKYNFLPNTDT
jgi:Notch-like protein